MLPLLLVFGEAPPPGLVPALEARGLLHRTATAQEAARSVNDGWADLVLCERVPGWQALVARVQAANAVPIVFGPAPAPAECRLFSAPVLSARTVEELEGPLTQAATLLARRRQDGAPEGAAERLREQAERTERVSRFAQSIALQLDLPHVVQEAIARTRDLCDADGASLLLVDPHSGGLTFDVVEGGAADKLAPVQLAPGNGIAGQVAKRAEPLLVEDVVRSPWFDPSCDAVSGFRTGSVIAAPLVLGGDLIGVLEAVRGADQPPFRTLHLERLVELAPHVGIAVHNAQITARLREAQAEVLRHNQELEARVDQRTHLLARAKREWESTFDAMHVPIAVQEGHRVRRSNLAFAALAGVPIRKVPGRKCYELIAGRTSPCPGCPLGKDGAGEAEIAAVGGRTLKAAAFRLPDEPDGWVMQYQDVTLERQLESRLRESERLASLGQLASGAAHEINNPLGFLVSNLRNLAETVEDLSSALDGSRAAAKRLRSGRVEEALAALGAVEDLDGELVSDAKEMIEESLGGARRVAEIVRGLRELSRQQMESADHAADVNAAVTRAVRAELSGLEGQVTQDLEARAPATIDPLQLDQALGHLLRNARQAVGPGQRIRVRTRDEDGAVVVEVEDEGAGIAEEHRGRIYEPFFTTRGVGRGIGLGLTATWGIVQRAGGTIDLRSELGTGTTFTLRLPPVAGRAEFQAA